jgi:hypothetical protein
MVDKNKGFNGSKLVIIDKSFGWKYPLYNQNTQSFAHTFEE